MITADSMKTIEQINKDIKLTRSLAGDFGQGDKAYKRYQKEAEFYRLMKTYLELNPTEAFLKKELVKKIKLLDSIKEGSYDYTRPEKKQAYYSLMGKKNILNQIKSLKYLLEVD
jgi:hypothetical protein